MRKDSVFIVECADHRVDNLLVTAADFGCDALIVRPVLGDCLNPVHVRIDVRVIASPCLGNLVRVHRERAGVHKDVIKKLHIVGRTDI